jgi:hypothetical protein
MFLKPFTSDYKRYDFYQSITAQNHIRETPYNGRLFLTHCVVAKADRCATQVPDYLGIMQKYSFGTPLSKWISVSAR